ncbi:MAG: hypothetical protein HQ518_15845, partial [Rhodopirellula sp.]|nr:hypothetical protein [Rhodopirellula sp.]
MFRISFQKIQTVGLVTTRGLLTTCSSHRHRMQTGMAAALVAVCVFGHRPGIAQGATFRVDDAALTVPAILKDQWNAVRHRKTWTRANGEKIEGEPRFIRFLARDYSFTTTEDILRVKTTWFSAGRCVSTDEAVNSLNTAKRRVIEAAFGSLNEMSHRLLKEPGGSENRIVIWAHFRSDREVSLPVDTLAAEELGVLSPFADLARQAFESRLFGDAQCKEIENSSEARAAARSGGRRMSPSRAQARMSSTRSAPRPTGGVVAGAIPQAATIPARTDRQVANSKKSKEKWAILVSQYVAEPGSLVFKLVGQFTRCVTAESEVKAISMV